MPAQTAAAETVYYTEWDTAPALEARLVDRNDNPIDLTGASVVIDIAFAMPRGTYYTSPRRRIVEDSPCVVDPDQSEGGRRGWVTWTPHDLSPPGQFLFQFIVTFPDGGVQTIASDTYDTMIIRTNVGGRKSTVQP